MDVRLVTDMCPNMHGLRVQRSRRKKNPADVVYCGRPTVFGNPYKMADAVEAGYASGDDEEAARRICVRAYLEWLALSPAALEAIDGFVLHGDEWAEKRRRILSAVPSLRGKRLSCWCPLDRLCHVDVLLWLANS